jgi:IS1 family transposase
VQVDEIWSYVQKKQRQVTQDDDRSHVGDMWTFVAIDADTKLVPAYRVGKRTRPHAVAFMADLSEQLANRVQLSSDGLITYVDAVERAFGADVDYGQAVKFYEAEPIGPGRYSPPRS